MFVISTRVILIFLFFFILYCFHLSVCLFICFAYIFQAKDSFLFISVLVAFFVKKTGKRGEKEEMMR